MGIFNTTESLEVDLTNTTKELVEMYLADDISRMDDEQRKEFCESAEAEALVEANVLRKPTLIRLGKQDDFTRRKKLAAFQLAKENNDPLWDKLCKNRVKEKQLIAAIVKKYDMKAVKVAKASQKEYIKTAGKTTANFKKMGGDAR